MQWFSDTFAGFDQSFISPILDPTVFLHPIAALMRSFEYFQGFKLWEKGKWVEIKDKNGPMSKEN